MSDSAELIPAAILAGGLATRLRPPSGKQLLKALIEVNDEPFLWHHLELLKRSGIHQIVLLVEIWERNPRTIRRRIGAGLKIEYSFDGPSLLGTAGAIRHAPPLLPERFFVLVR